ncbi:MAG: hypothetical protein LBV15_01085, partial [Planctomycetota bacterium]|nr:hypothetical protein [Planctomycetota bacterium]
MSDRLSTKLKKLALLLAADVFLAAIAAHLAPSLSAGGESPLPLGLLLFLFAGLFVIAAVFLVDMVFQDKGKIQEFLETVRLPATVMDGEGRLIFTNQTMKHLLGNSVGRLAAIVSSGNAAVYDF